MRMPWGKYKGEELETVPDSYLWWVLDNADAASPLLLDAIRRQLGIEEEQPGSGGAGGAATKAPPGAVLKRDVENAVSGVVRRLSMQYHPDRGGTNAQMQVVNEATVALRRALEAVQEVK